MTVMADMELGHVQDIAIRPTRRAHLLAWIKVGTQSIGGGSAALYLMRRYFVETGWLPERNFLEYWTISKITPGIGQISLSALIGRQIDGSRGVIIAVVGMVVPAAVITAIMTALLISVADVPLLTAALRGAYPATLGMMIGLMVATARSAARSGRAATVDFAIFAAVVAIGLLTTINPIAIYVAGAVLGVVALGRGRSHPRESPETIPPALGE